VEEEIQEKKIEGETTMQKESTEKNDDDDVEDGDEESNRGDNEKDSKEVEIEESKEQDDADDDDDDEQWAVKRMITSDEIDSDSPLLCQTDECTMIACAVWISDGGETWNSCLDCQDKVSYTNNYSYLISCYQIFMLQIHYFSFIF